MAYIKKIIGKRIALGIMEADGAERCAKWMNDLTVTDNLGTTFNIYTVEAEKNWIINNAREYQFAIIRLEDEQWIGNCGLHAINQISQCAEVGIFIGDDENRNQGYGREALSLLIDYAFDSLNLHSLMLQVFSFNEQAISCYKKVGFEEMGRRRESYYAKGQFHDTVYMDILREDWRKRC